MYENSFLNSLLISILYTSLLKYWISQKYTNKTCKAQTRTLNCVSQYFDIIKV